MIYTSNEIRRTIAMLENGGDDLGSEVPSLNRQLMARAADMMDDMLYALHRWDTFSSYLAAHGMLPSGSNSEVAKFWNRPQDSENTRIWDNELNIL